MKKILISLAIIGIVAGVTLGVTGAWWSSSATSHNASFHSGTMKLQLANSYKGTLEDTVDETWDKDNMEPGGTVLDKSLFMKNVGSIDAHRMNFAVTGITNPDGLNMAKRMRITKLDYGVYEGGGNWNMASLLTGGAGVDWSNYIASTRAATITDCDVTVDNNDGDSSTPNTIQDGISSATDKNGDGKTVVCVKPGTGTYNEQLTITKTLTLQGISQPTLDVSNYAGYGIDVTANNVTIDGFTIIGIPYSGSASSANNPTVKAEANNVTVQNCVFNNATGTKGKEAMLAMPGTNHINFLNNEVSNYIYGITARGNGWGGSAELPADGVEYLTVSGNTFDVAYVDDGSQITGEAVQIHYGDNIVVTNNTVHGPGTFETSTYDLINSIGIADFMSGYGAAGAVNYSNNEVTNCYVGIATFAGNGQISNNTVTGNNIGIQVGQNDDVYISTPAQGVAIEHNDIENNARGIWVQNFVRDGLAAHYNNIVGNTEYGGVLNEDPEGDVFDATNNWWGWWGTMMDESEIQKMVSDNVKWNPYAGGPFIGFINGIDSDNNGFADLYDFYLQRGQGLNVNYVNSGLGLNHGQWGKLDMAVQLDGPTTGNDYRNKTLGMDMTVNMNQH